MAIGTGQPTHTFSTLGIIVAPSASGVYAICNAKGGYIYFGESNDIQRRLGEHLAETGTCIKRHGAALFAYELIAGEAQRVARQNQLIAAYATPCNRIFG